MIRLRGCAGWSAPLLFAYGIRHVFAWPVPCGSLLQGPKNRDSNRCFPISIVLLKSKWKTPENWPELKLEPRHVKTNKVRVRPAKTQISLGIRPVWSQSSLSAWRKLGSLATHWAKTLIRLGGCPGWSESSLGAHSFCWFCHVAAHLW